MTRVEEWTKAEIGVGAAIAIGSQGEKGYKALFVIKVKTSIKGKNQVVGNTEVNEVKSG